MRVFMAIIWAVAALVACQTAGVFNANADRWVFLPPNARSQVWLAEKPQDPSTNDPEPDKADTSASQKIDPGETGKPVPKPLKPFQPSERIKADQDVDFPYDI